MSLRTTTAPTSRRGGFTLLEVAIALVIFVIGSLAIVRLFPPALGLIQSSSDRNTALSLNSALLARLTNQGVSIPDSIYNGNDSAPFAPVDYTGLVLGSSRRELSLPANPINSAETEFQASALDHYRCINGERHTSPGSTSAQYILTHFPYSELTVSQEASVEGVVLDSATKTLDFTRATVSGTSIADGTNPTQPSAAYRYANGTTAGDTIFYVSYRWLDTGTGKLGGVVDEPFVSLTADTANALVSAGLEPAYNVQPGNVIVRMKKVLASTADTALYNPPLEDRQKGFIDLSLVPGAAPATEYVFDYSVLGWRWLTIDSQGTVEKQDKDVPRTQLMYTVPLPVGHIDDSLPVFLTGLLDDGTGGPGLGGVIRSDSATPGTGHGMVNQPGNIAGDVREGMAYFHVDQTKPPKSIRVTYRTLENWTQQLTVASSSYKPVTGNNIGASSDAWRETWRDYCIVGGSLYFKPAEVGKAVFATYSYDQTGNKSAHQKLLAISQDTINTPAGVPAGFDLNGKVAYLNLTDATGNALTAANNVTVAELRGTSVTSRTAWISGNHYGQTASTTYRGVN